MLRKHFATPTSRRRLFIILIRRDVLAADVAAADFTEVVKARLTGILKEFSEMETPEWSLDSKF